MPGKSKIIVLLSVVFLLAAMLGGCSPPEETPAPAPPPPSPDNDNGEVELGEPLKIGFIAALTGTFAANGMDMRDGLIMFLDEREWVLAGRPIELAVEDDENVPATSLVKARKLVELDEVDMIAGPLSAACGLAVAEYARENNIFNLVPVVSADDLTQRLHSNYVVRTGWTSSQPMQPFGEWVYNELGYRKVATIAYDFAFGHETIKGFQYTFEELGGEVVLNLWPPIGTPDYGPYLSLLPDDIDAVVANFSGADGLRFLSQYEEFGFKEQFPLLGAGTLTDEHILPSMGDEALDIITALHYSPMLDNPINKSFVERYMQRYGRVPSYYSDACYSGMAFLEAALKEVDDITDVDALSTALKSAQIDTARGPMAFDEYNNPVQNIYIRKVEKVDGKLQNTVIHTIPGVSQFWKYDPQEFLSRPVYSRDFPPQRG